MSRRRARLLVAGAVVALIATQYAGAVLGGGVYHFEDAADNFYPAREMTRRALAEGTLPLWDEGSWSGWPPIVDPYNGVFYPLNAVYYVLGGARGLGYSLALHAILAALGLYAFLRRRRLGRLAALGGGLAYALSSFMVVWARHVDFLQMAAWIPWILWAFDRWLEERRLRTLLLLALFGGLCLLTGALSLIALAALPLGGYAAARLAVTWRAVAPGERRRRVLRDLGALGGAAALGVGLAAAAILPALAHLPESPRALGTSYQFASSYAWPNLRYALTLLVPDVYGNNMRGRYVGAFNYWEMAGYYVGVATWMLAPLAALWRPAPPARRRLELLVLAALALVAVGAALGPNGFVHPALYHGLPLYATLRCPARALYVIVLVVPILAAHGADALLAEARAAARRLGPRFFAVLGVTAAALGIAVAVLVQLPAGATVPRAGALRLLLFAALTGSALLGRAARLIGPRVTGVALVALVGSDLLWQNRGYLVAEPPTFPQGTERFQALEWVREHGRGARFVNDGHGPFRLHNVGLTYGLENASGYDSVPIWRYRNFLRIVNTGRPYPYPTLRHDLAAAAVVNFGSRLLDLLNVRYIVTFRALPPPRFRLVFRPATRGAHLAWAEPGWDRRLVVYENEDALPRAFVVHEATVVPDGAAAAAAIAAPGFDPARTVVLEEAPDPPPAPAPGAPGLAPATMRRHERHRLVIDVATERAGVLVISEVYYPGWRARLDGRPARLLRADYALRAVALPPGRHEVELVYRNRAALGGLGLSLAALLGLAGAAVWTWRTRRRRRTEEEERAPTRAAAG